MRCLFSTHWKECQALVLIRKASWSVMLCSQMTVEYTEIMNQEVRIRKTCLLTKPTQKGVGLFPMQMSRIGRFRMHVHTSPSAWKNVYCLGAFPCRNLSDLEHLIVNPESFPAAFRYFLLFWPSFVEGMVLPGQTTFPIMVTGSEGCGLPAGLCCYLRHRGLGSVQVWRK